MKHQEQSITVIVSFVDNFLNEIMWRSLVLLGLLFGFGSTKVSRRKNDRSIQVINQSKTHFEIYWVHPDTGDTVLMSDPYVPNGGDFNLNSFVGHEFEVREMRGNDGKCKEKKCRTTHYTVSENDEQIVTISPDYKAIFVDTKVKAQKEATVLIGECQARAKERIQKAGSDQTAALKAMEDLVGCVQDGVAERLEKVNEDIAFQASIRKDIAAQLENYTCIDDKMESSKDIDTYQWRYKDGISRTVHVKHERPASRIHVIDNFINEDECQAMEEAAARTLHRATVADGKGGSKFSENRKAMQAGIQVPWNKEAEGDPITRISRRVYDYTNHVLGLDIKENGQEDLMSIQYFGRGLNDTEPDQYTPHCDGDCTGLPHKSGTRMATMVMYCTVADRGGHTNFRNSGVHVKPEKGNGVFFSYIDPETRVMDTGFTEHSGCPVYEGQKKIVTQWIRLGVDDQNPWDSFNTLGIKRSEMQVKYINSDYEDYDDDDDKANDEL